MQFEIPDDIVRRAEANAGEMRIALAVQLYADNRLDYHDACRLAGIAETEFGRELLNRAMSIQQYPPAQGRSHRTAG